MMQLGSDAGGPLGLGLPKPKNRTHRLKRNDTWQFRTSHRQSCRHDSVSSALNAQVQTVQGVTDASSVGVSEGFLGGIRKTLESRPEQLLHG
jgi:hypothetical protein